MFTVLAQSYHSQDYLWSSLYRLYVLPLTKWMDYTII